MTGDRIGDMPVAVLKALVRDLLVRVERMDLFDDVYQEAALAAWQAVGTFDPAKGALGPRQYARARFAALDELRRQTRKESVSLDALPPWADPGVEEPGYDDAEAAALFAWAEDEIRAVWPNALRCESAAVAVAVLLDGRQVTALARERGVHHGAITQAVRTTRKRLRERWSDDSPSLALPRSA